MTMVILAWSSNSAQILSQFPVTPRMNFDWFSQLALTTKVEDC